MTSFPEVGDTQTLTLSVVDAADSPVDPATLVLTIDPPTGARIVETFPHSNLVHPGTGQYQRQLTYAEAGMWRYQWATTGPAMTEGERINVRPATLDVLPFSLSLEELKRRVDHKMDVDEDLLADDLAAAVQQAQEPPPYGSGRLLVPNPLRDTDAPVTLECSTTRRRVRVRDAREVTGVTVDGSPVTGWGTLSQDGVVVQLSLPDDGRWTRWPDGSLAAQPYVERAVAVTGRFGFAQVPVALAGAIYQLAARWHYERQAQYADQVEVLEGTAVQAYYRQIPPRVALVFKSFAVPAGVGGLR